MIGSIDLEYMRHGPGPVLRRWGSYFLFEGRSITARGRWLNPMIFAWLKALANLPGNPGVNAPIFITGLGRSGTTILGVLLSLHRNVGHLSEPKALWQVIDPRQDINTNYSTAGARFRLSAEDVTPEIALRARRLYARYLGCAVARRVVDKYPEMIFRVGYLRAIFPDAKFIFITRGGPDAVISVAKWSERFGTKSDTHNRDWWGRNDQKWHYLREQLILQDPAYQSVWSVANSDLDDINRAALEWIVTMREGLAQEQRYPHAVIRVAYETLLADPGGELVRLQQQCGLVPDPSVADYAKKRLYDNPAKGWPKLHPAVDALFRDTMIKLGYDTP